MLARAEDGEGAIVPGDRWTSAAWFTLVARHGRVAEVDAARALQQVAANGGHVADLC